MTVQRKTGVGRPTWGLRREKRAGSRRVVMVAMTGLAEDRHHFPYWPQQARHGGGGLVQSCPSPHPRCLAHSAYPLPALHVTQQVTQS